MNNIEELKKAALVATPGPWTSQSGYPRMIVSETEKWTHYDDCGNPEFTGPAWVCNVGDAQNNADFISLANPAAILALIAQLEAAQKLAQHYLDQRNAAEQVSAAALRDWAKEGQRAETAEAELSAANEKLSKPVVLPPRRSASYFVDEEFSNEDLAAIYNAARLEFSVKVKNAGFTVEGE
ncbi:hypothetical protein [Yersinia mollaretii]|uniref:hypothetical protein n=1 Tax=Yersinia mollaretii TaxID=33060 RepID=UPI000C1544B1|nr:hypothetical protein [Yersinia mollaretii]MDA5529070.1 hypothetical protein [Yersinia mollaretii]MDR7875771.1 hypothetical protein [Yersinia mollaretii]PHZ29595.1 hypothetical protein CS537_21705 [Yersinia mollaretii]WQC76885.1 hypothetical protein U1Z61_10570 [Yersinia mollaretii]